MRYRWILALAPMAMWGQEAGTGFELRTTLSEQGVYSHVLSAAPRGGSPIAGGFRGMLYPSLKLNSHWTLAGTVQVHSRPYFYEELNTQDFGMRADVLQLHLSYARFWNKASVVVRVGELSSAFGSFLLRYDDARNPLVDMPLAYGYYYKNVSTYGMAGAQADATWGKLDARVQFANSSPGNRRSIFDKDQYANWAGGAGYTIRQGLRVGVSGLYGPYLHRAHRRFFRGEARPKDLPEAAGGVDVEWEQGYWSVNGEWQRFVMPYRAMPFYRRSVGYAEVRRALHPRWYIAGRAGYARATAGPPLEVYEVAVGYRPGAHQVLKAGYEIQHGPGIRGTLANALVVQVVTSFRVWSTGR